MNSAAVHIALSYEEAVEELRAMEPPPSEIIRLDMSAPNACLATALFEIVHMKTAYPLAVLVILTGLLRARDNDNANLRSMSALIHPATELRGTIFHRLRDIIMGLIRTPVTYRQSAELLEILSHRLNEQRKLREAVAREKWRNKRP